MTTTTHKPVTCKECKTKFTPQISFSGLVVSGYCISCRIKIEQAKRKIQIDKRNVREVISDKTALKMKTAVVKQSFTTENTDGRKKKIGKRNTEKGLIAKLDKVFSLFIRQRDSKDGFFKCISCGLPKPYRLADNGHFINRSNMTTRYDEINCNAQCSYCNRFREGAAQGYREGLIKKYGEQAVDRLEMKRHNTSHITSVELEIMIRLYKAKLKLK